MKPKTTKFKKQLNLKMKTSKAKNQPNYLLLECFSEFNTNCGFYFSRIINVPLVPPEMIQISLTHRCSLQCKMCTIAKNPSKISEEMNTDEVKNLIDQAKKMGIQEVYLTGGEPFIRKDCIEIIEHISSKHMKSSINTSGAFINKDNAERIVSSGLSVLTFSIDGMKKIHDNLRGTGVFDHAIKMIKLINTIKIKKKSKTPIIGITTLIMNHNLDDLISLIKLAESLQVGRITFQPVLVDNTKMFIQDLTNNFWVPKERLNKLDSVLDDIQQYANISKVSIVFDPQMIKDYFRGKFSQKKCFVGFTRLFVGLWGNVGLVCPYDEKNFAAIDNFRNKSISKIWNSHKLREARKVVKECEKQCVQGCSLQSNAEDLLKIYNTTLQKAKSYSFTNYEMAELLNEMLSSIKKYKNILKKYISDETLIPEIHAALKLINIIEEDIMLKLSLIKSSSYIKNFSEMNIFMKEIVSAQLKEIMEKNKEIESELKLIRTSFAYKIIANPLDAAYRKLKELVK